MESASSTGTGASRSHRSSFACERLSLDGNGQLPTSNDTPQPALSQQHLELLCQQIGIPKALCNRYAAGHAMLLALVQACNCVEDARRHCVHIPVPSIWHFWHENAKSTEACSKQACIGSCKQRMPYTSAFLMLASCPAQACPDTLTGASIKVQMVHTAKFASRNI